MLLAAAAVVLARLQLVDFHPGEAAQVDAHRRRAVGRRALGEGLDATVRTVAMVQPLLAELVVAERGRTRFDRELGPRGEGPDGAELAADRAIALQRLV